MSEKKLPECPPKEDVPLFHVTPKRNLPSIAEHGLKPSLGELTQEAFIRHRSDELEGQGLDEEEVEEQVDREVDLMPDMVFATRGKYLSAAVAMLSKNILAPTPLADLAVIGIKEECEGQFEDKEVASDIDVVSEKVVHPRCLCKLPEKEWKPEYLKHWYF